MSRAIDDTIEAFREHRNRWYGREYDLQSYMYHRVLVHAGVDASDTAKEPERVPIRREHRIWKEPSGKRKDILKEVDLALLDSAHVSEKEMRHPVCEIVELKYPVEAKTGLTEYDQHTLKEVDPRSDCYKRVAKNRFGRKFLEDYTKLDELLPSAKNLTEDVRCRMLYFDLIRGSYWQSPDEIREARMKGIKRDLTRVGDRPLEFTYIFAIEKTDESDVWLPNEFA